MSKRGPPVIVVREYAGRPFYEAFWRADGKQVKRRVGAAWLVRDGEGWRRRRGRVPEGSFDEAGAHVEAARIAAAHIAHARERLRLDSERHERGPSFREVAQGYLRWLEQVMAAKPSTLLDYRYLLAEPGTPHRRGEGASSGHIMGALGDLPASRVTVGDVEALLCKLADAGASPRVVNKHRALVSAIFGYGMKDASFALPLNPAAAADKRKEADRGALLFYSPEEIEKLARSLAEGTHRDPNRPAVGEQEIAEDRQDGELIRVAAYAGLRQGELLVLRWCDIDFKGNALTVARASSAGVETSTKSGRVRRVPLPDQAAEALKRIKAREHFTAPDELVFCNVLGRGLNGSALRRRFKRSRDKAKLRPLRFHDLRHTYGSLLAAAGVDLVTIQAALGHAALSTTSRYLHARPASEQAELFTRIFASGANASSREEEANHE